MREISSRTINESAFETSTFIILAALLLLLLSLSSVTMTDILYPVAWDFPSENHARATHAIVEFINGQSPNIGVEMTVAEQSHMIDVRELLSEGKVLLVILASTLAILCLTSKRTIDEYILTAKKTSVLALCITIVTILGFPILFTWFHQVFFPQGNWMFPANSTLITLFPASFFVHLVVLVLVVELLLCISTLFILGRIKRHHSKKQLLTTYSR